MTTVATVRGLENLSGSDLNALVYTAHEIGIDPDWLASVISFETAGTFDPAKQNPASKATGLIQFLPSTIKAMASKGLIPADATIDSVKNLSFGAQLDYVEAYYKWVHPGKLKTLDDAYMVVFYPPAVGQSADFVIGKADSDDPKERARYQQNAFLDKSGSGLILKRDAASQVKGVLTYASNEPRTNVPYAVAGILGGGSGGSSLFHLAVIGGVGYGLFHMWRKRS